MAFNKMSFKKEQHQKQLFEFHVTNSCAAEQYMEAPVYVVSVLTHDLSPAV